MERGYAGNEKMKIKEQLRFHAMEAAILLTILLGGAFSFYQVGSHLFACGSEYAGSEIRYWLILSSIQVILFLAQGLSSKIFHSYRLSQLLTLPLVLLILVQVAIAYPRIFIYIAAFVSVYWYTRWVIGKLLRKPFQMPQIGAATAETVIFLLLTLVTHSTLAFAILHTPNIFLGDRVFFSVMAISAVIAVWIIRTGPTFNNISLNQLPPLGMLIIVLLRAKFPDGAYDSLFYKATLPIMIADWRTAITGAIDHTLLGTDFFEIMNSQLRILDNSYSPAMISSLSFLGLWVIVPIAMEQLLTKNFVGRQSSVNIATLLLVSLSEMLIAAGTAYHEPMMGLLVVASLMIMPASWIFLGAAVAAKITVLFICPLIVGLKLMSIPLNRNRLIDGNEVKLPTRVKESINGLIIRVPFQSKSKFLVVIVCLTLATIVVGEQFYRNIAYTGRLMGVSESLSSFTDPDARKLAPSQETTVFDVVTKRGFLEKVGTTFVHVLTLDRWIKPTALGFHIMPTSRLIAVMAVVAILVFVFPVLRRNHRLLALCLLWYISAFLLLNFFSQGRHLFPLSICAAILIAMVVGEGMRKTKESGNRAVEILFYFFIAFAAMGDQVIGSFINNAWECRRNIAGSVITNNYDQPESAIEHRLRDIVIQYRALPASHLSVSPTILCEPQVERMHYLGVHYIYAGATFDLNLRHLAANSYNMKLLPTSLLAVCYIDPKFPDQILPPEIRSEFIEVQSVDNIHILVSKPLMSGAKTTSLVGSQMNIFSFTDNYEFDFLKNWEFATLTNVSPADTPNGRGAFSGEISGDKVGFIVSPYGVTFNNVVFRKSSQIELQLGMYYANSDGMVVELILEDVKGAKQTARFELKPKPELSNDPVWMTWNVPVQPLLEGSGRLTILAKSDGGNSSADWAVFRKLALVLR